MPDNLTPWDAPKPNEGLKKKFMSFTSKRATQLHNGFHNALFPNKKKRQFKFKSIGSFLLKWNLPILWYACGAAMAGLVMFPSPKMTAFGRITDVLLAVFYFAAASWLIGHKLGKRAGKQRRAIDDHIMRMEVEQEIRDEYRRKLGI